MKPVIDKTKCTSCGTCVNYCPMNFFKMVNGKAVINDNPDGDCLGCGACVNSCPSSAITLVDETKKTKGKK
ncbi:MAG: 4Fe-4S binding protein [Candidatus Nanoarchaeia archaeon]|jgi:pyruvate ferredoxin oxidoreductase delta subunit/phenylglyoxylate dehydrogenase delta subunit